MSLTSAEKHFNDGEEDDGSLRRKADYSFILKKKRKRFMIKCKRYKRTMKFFALLTSI